MSRSDAPSLPPRASSRVRGLLDASVVIDLDLIDDDLLPPETAISAVTLAELAAGPRATADELERGRRQDRLQWAASSWDPLPLDAEVARPYGRLYATLRGSGRASHRRFADLLIAATALAHSLPLFTRNPTDFAGLEDLVQINGL